MKTLTAIKINTIDITALEWFDKVNGNSYFSATVTLNYGTPEQKEIKLPFQYGYGSHYIDMAKQELVKLGLIETDRPMQALWSYCEEHKIILRTNKYENCKKRELYNPSKY